MKRLLFVIALLPLLLIFSFRGKENIPGTRYIYSWDSKTTALTDIKKLYKMDTAANAISFFQSKSLQLINLDIRCHIRKTIIETNNTGQLVGFEIINPKVILRQNGEPVNNELLHQELTHPVLAEINAQGLIKLVRIDSAISQVAGGLIKEMLSHMQFASRTGTSTEWQAKEENTAGSFMARYQLLDSNKSGYTWSRSNDGYVKLRSLVPDQVIKDNGRTAISVDSLGVITGIDMIEAKAVLVHDDTVSLSKGKAMAHLISMDTATNGEMTTLKQLAGLAQYQDSAPLSAGLSDEKINRLTYSTTLGEDNYQTLTAALQIVGRNEEAIDRLTSKFRALAYLQPVHCKDMGNLLQSVAVDSPEFKVLSEALNNAQTLAAVDAIADVVMARINEEDVLIELLPMLATTNAPTAKAETTIRQLLLSEASPVIKSTAELTLGALAYNFKKSDAGRSANIAVYLLERMQMESDTIQKILVLANTGSAQVLPVLKPYFESRSVSAEVRLTAILGLRLINDQQADELLEKMLDENDPVIVETAEQVIAFRRERAKDR